MHGYLCVYYNFRVMHLFAELDMDWIGYGSKSCLQSWIGLDWILKNGPMRHSDLVVFITVQNLVGIDAVVLIICTFFDFVSLA